MQFAHNVGTRCDGLVEMAPHRLGIRGAARAIDATPTFDQGLSAGGRLETNTTPVRQPSSANATLPSGSGYRDSSFNPRMRVSQSMPAAASS